MRGNPSKHHHPLSRPTSIQINLTRQFRTYARELFSPFFIYLVPRNFATFALTDVNMTEILPYSQAAETKLASELEVFLLRSPCLTPPKEVISVNTRTSDVGTTNPEHGLSRIDHTPGSDDTKGRVTPAHVTFDEVLTSWHQVRDRRPGSSKMQTYDVAMTSSRLPCDCRLSHAR